MGISKYTVTHSMNLMAADAVSLLHELKPEIAEFRWMYLFSKSKTYSLLYDFETKLWTRGSSSIVRAYLYELLECNSLQVLKLEEVQSMIDNLESDALDSDTSDSFDNTSEFSN